MHFFSYGFGSNLNNLLYFYNWISTQTIAYMKVQFSLKIVFIYFFKFASYKWTISKLFFIFYLNVFLKYA